MEGKPKKSVLDNEDIGNQNYAAFVCKNEEFDSERGAFTKVARVFIYDSMEKKIREVAKFDLGDLFISWIAVVRKGSFYRLYVLTQILETNSCRPDCIRYIDIKIHEFGIYGTGAWHIVPTRIPGMRTQAGAVMIDPDTLIMCGGHDRDINDYTTSCVSIDVDTGFTLCFPDMINPRYFADAVKYRETVVIIGGSTFKSTSCPFKGAVCEQYDPVTGMWVEIGRPMMDIDLPSAVVANSKVYVTNLHIPHVGIYDGHTWTVVDIIPYAFTKGELLCCVPLKCEILRCWTGSKREAAWLEIMDLDTLRVGPFRDCRLPEYTLVGVASF